MPRPSLKSSLPRSRPPRRGKNPPATQAPIPAEEAALMVPGGCSVEMVEQMVLENLLVGHLRGGRLVVDPDSVHQWIAVMDYLRTAP